MSTSDPFLPVQRDEQPDLPPTEVELEEERADRPDPEGDGSVDRGLPPTPPTAFQAPDGESVDPEGL